MVEIASACVAAYYTLSAASIPLLDLPPDETKRLPRYPTLPAVLIGRLAATGTHVDRRFQRRGLGELMLMNAVHRTMQDAAAAFALLVDAKNASGGRLLSTVRIPARCGPARDSFLAACDGPKDAPSGALDLSASTAVSLPCVR